MLDNGQTVPTGFTVGSLSITTTRGDYVNTHDSGDANSDDKSGCSLLFISYLFTQLGFPIVDIVKSGGNNLRDVYRKLTSDNANPFPFFQLVFDARFPGISGVTSPLDEDDPFPLAIVGFTNDKNVFSKDEVFDCINNKGGTFRSSIRFTVDGFSRRTLGATQPTFGGPDLPNLGVAISVDGSRVEWVRNNMLIPQQLLSTSTFTAIILFCQCLISLPK